MAGPFVRDITGQTRGQLTAISQIEGRWWLFKCTCGKRKKMDASKFLAGQIATCGDKRLHSSPQNKFRAKETLETASDEEAAEPRSFGRNGAKK